MAASTIVMVLDLDDPKRGEMNVVNDSREAEQLVESLLQSGLGQERIRVFSATAMEMQVVHRPVVSLVAPGGNGTAENETEPAHSGSTL
jgi:hypothetical protein